MANTQLEFCIWVQKIKDALSCSEWKVVDPLQIRFFSERMGNNCTSFVDGEQYFGELFNCLNLAEKEVYIIGLLLCPFLYLKRPVSLNSEKEELKDNVIEIEFRFDKIIEKLVF